MSLSAILNIPEIQDGILGNSFILHSHDLAQLLRVNKTWEAMIHPFLWTTIVKNRHIIPPRHLVTKNAHWIRNLETDNETLVKHAARAPNCTRLLRLSIPGCKQYTGTKAFPLTTSRLLLQQNPGLKAFRFWDASRAGGVLFSPLLPALANTHGLRELDLQGVLLEGLVLSRLFQYCPNIEDLRIKDCRCFGSEVDTIVKDWFPTKIKNLSLNALKQHNVRIHSWSGDYGIRLLTPIVAPCRTLQQLEIEVLTIDLLTSFLAVCQSSLFHDLVSLTLKIEIGPYLPSGSLVEPLTHDILRTLPALTTLKVKTHHFGKTSINWMSDSLDWKRTLKVLVIENVTKIPGTTIQLILCSFPNLTDFHVDRGASLLTFDDVASSEWACKKLKSLSIDVAREKWDKDKENQLMKTLFVQISKLIYLEKLYLRIGIDEQGREDELFLSNLQLLEACTWLRVLDVETNVFTLQNRATEWAVKTWPEERTKISFGYFWLPKLFNSEFPNRFS